MAVSMPESKNKKRVFIVDDHPVFREGLVGLVKREPGWMVCGEADNVAQALTDIERAKPDLLLADISLPGRGGLELIKDVRAMQPSLAVLVISMHDESLYAERVLRAGGRGYIMKQAGPDKMLQAIRLVIEGQIYLSEKMSVRILDAFSGKSQKSSSPISRLTDRELEILELIGQGKDSAVISRELNLSSKTVDAHRGHIKEKLQLKNGTELICYAARWVETQRPMSA
jgi:DNA-binding NarL/FixJ family response regulator